jgi:hypothetical protein
VSFDHGPGTLPAVFEYGRAAAARGCDHPNQPGTDAHLRHPQDDGPTPQRLTPLLEALARTPRRLGPAHRIAQDVEDGDGA